MQLKHKRNEYKNDERQFLRDLKGCFGWHKCLMMLKGENGLEMITKSEFNEMTRHKKIGGKSWFDIAEEHMDHFEYIDGFDLFKKSKYIMTSFTGFNYTPTESTDLL